MTTIIKWHNGAKRNMMKRYFTVLMILMPILNIYKLPGVPIGIGEIVLICLIPFLISQMFDKRFTISVYFIFLCYSVIVTLITLILITNNSYIDVFGKYGRIILYSLCFLVFSKNFMDIEFGSKVYQFIACAVSLYLIFEFITKAVFGIILPWIIPNTELNYTFTNYVEYMKVYNGFIAMNLYRPSSIFLEVSHFTEYVAPALVLMLFPWKEGEKANIKAAMVVTVTCVISLSAEGLAFVAIIWIMWYFKYYFTAKKILPSLCIFAVGVAIVIYLSENTTVIQMFLYRIGTIGQAGSTTGSLRFLRGFYIFNRLDIINQFFGIGFGNLVEYMAIHSITTPFDVGIGADNEYMSTISYLLVSTGIVGSGIYLAAIIRFFRKGCTTQRCMIILFCIMIASSSVFLSAMYMLPMIFIAYEKFTEQYNNHTCTSLIKAH